MNYYYNTYHRFLTPRWSLPMLVFRIYYKSLAVKDLAQYRTATVEARTIEDALTLLYDALKDPLRLKYGIIQYNVPALNPLPEGRVVDL